MAGIENDELLKAIQSKLEEYAQNGKTYKDFLGDVDQIFGSFGVTPPAPYRIQTVFRTNLYTAYSVAQLEQIDQMRDRFPVWRYMAIMDSATRPSHAALNGNIYREGEGPYPPLKNGDGGGLSFNCRCSAQHLHQYQVDKNVQNAIMPGEAFDLSGISEAERASFEGYLAEKQTDMAPAIKQQVQSSL